MAPDPTEEQDFAFMGQIQTLDDLIGLLIRRRWLIVAVTVLGAMISVYVGANRPKTYESTAVIQVELPVVAGAAQTGAVGSAGLLQAIEQRLTSRENLLAVVERQGLFAGVPGLADDQKIGILRASIRLQSVASVAGGYGPASVSAILVTARLGDPEQTARVANDFAQSILDLSSEGQSSRAAETFTFYQEEASRIGQEIVALEAEIADYKNTHRTALPGQGGELSNVDAELRALDQQQVALLGERATFERKSVLRATDRNRMQDLSAQIDVIAAQKTALLTRRAEMEAAQAAVPEVERTLNGYDRRLQQLQDQADVVNVRLAEAQTSQRLAERQQSERFTLLERAITPLYPTGSGGKKLAIMGAVASLGAALALAFVLDLMFPVIRTRAQLERQLDLRAVVAIPEVPLPKRRPAPGAQAARALGRRFDLRNPLAAAPRYAIVVGGAALVLMMAVAMS